MMGHRVVTAVHLPLPMDLVFITWDDGSKSVSISRPREDGSPSVSRSGPRDGGLDTSCCCCSSSKGCPRAWSGIVSCEYRKGELLVCIKSDMFLH